ncbi:MAG: RecQ family ATP-dependent DNA helicase [Thermomicrobiales bacterium]
MKTKPPRRRSRRGRKTAPQRPNARPPDVSSAALRRLARERLGYARLRPGQEAALTAVIAGRDTLAVLPTGGGKSAIYQLAGLRIPGQTVVISPLLALQRDQVETIADADIGGAVQVNSDVDASERHAALDAFARAEREFLFVAPEQFANETLLERLQQVRPALFVVDEAHCISEWGHDFRPAYLRLGAVIEALGHPTILALTATASPVVRDEIVTRLGMRDPQVVVRDFDRPNLWLRVTQFEDEAARDEALLQRVIAAPKPGIVYTATRRETEELAGVLAGHGVRAVAYHAGLRTEEREAAQTAFMDDTIEVIVATIAFGLGVDKPNVRFVYHHRISDALDAYYQEIGRAGRDGEPAEAWLCYRSADLGLRRFFAGSGQVDAAQIAQVAEAVQEQDGATDSDTLRAETNLSVAKVTAALTHLDDAGVIAILVNGDAIASEDTATLAENVAAATEAEERQQAFEASRLEMMRGYAETRDCRRAYLLNYFGEPFEGPCGHCDNCEAGSAAIGTAGEQPFPLNSCVRHQAWGMGRVMRYEGDKLVVLFDAVGYKTLARDRVVDTGLLTAVRERDTS